MPMLPDRKVGLIACSGEDLPEGTVSRMATLRVLEALRPADTVTLCLPLFLAGEERERAFARFYPTIAIDGCDKRCAARATEHYSGRPAASLVVSDIVTAEGLAPPGGARRLDAAGERAAEAVAAAIAVEVDRLLPRRPARVADVAPAEASAPAAEPAPMVPAGCSCGSGIAAGRIAVNGRSVELVALPLILDLFRQEGRAPGEATADALFETVATYNAIEAADAPAIRAAVLRAYELLCAQPARPVTAR